MKKTIQSISLIVALVTLPGCGWFGGSKSPDRKAGDHDKYASVKEIKVEDLKTRLSESKELLVLNVLSKEAYDDCHIMGSQSIPLADLKSASSGWDKGKEIVVYCANYHCSASKEAYLKLTVLGFTNVRAYEGGMREWRDAGYSSEGPCKKSYLTK